MMPSYGMAWLMMTKKTGMALFPPYFMNPAVLSQGLIDDV
jgi:hypothetical protein